MPVGWDVIGPRVRSSVMAKRKIGPFRESNTDRVACNLAVAARVVQLSAFVISLYLTTLCQMQRFGSVTLECTCQR